MEDRPEPASRIGILGGTFDPPHNGHVVLGVNAADQLDLDRTLFVVANAPWQKVDERLIETAEVRLEMVRAVLDEVVPVGEQSHRLETSDIEIARGGRTYTADTLAEIDRLHPGSELWLIVGVDVARTLHTWKRLDEVRTLAGLAIVDRGDESPPFDDLRADGWRVAQVVIPRLDISSSEVRARLRDGRPVDGLVPPAAIRIIQERGLYADRR